MSTRRARPPVIDAAAGARAARLLGWPGVGLAPMRLFGVRVLPVVVLDLDAHRARQVSGDGPQLDGDTPRCVGVARVRRVCPASGGGAVRVGGPQPQSRGARVACGVEQGAQHARVRGRSRTHRQRVQDEVCLLEHAFHGIGLITTTEAGEVAAAAPGRASRARRRTADRWVEELLYAAALTSGHLPAGDDTS